MTVHCDCARENQSKSHPCAQLTNLLIEHKGVILIDSPERNHNAQSLLSSLGFREISATTRMYKGSHKAVLTKDVYGLACLELG